MWTDTELRSSCRDYRGEVWRVVEAQHHISTLRLAKSLAEQRRLEELAHAVKPKLPRAARELHWLLASPFRYGHRSESRFRRADEKPGIFYGSEQERTALSEVAYWRMRFLSRSPGLSIPASTTAYTSFSVDVRSAAALDLSQPPLDQDLAWWTHKEDYSRCQDLAKVARHCGVQCIRSPSARDPKRGHNLAVLDPAVFSGKEPKLARTWHLRCEAGRVSVQTDLLSGSAGHVYTFQVADFEAGGGSSPRSILPR